MKTLLSAAAVLALAAGAAQAQPDQTWRGQHSAPAPAARSAPSAPARGYAPPARAYAPPARPAYQAPSHAYASPPSYRGGQYNPAARSQPYRGGQYGQNAPGQPYRGVTPRTQYQAPNRNAPGAYGTDRRYGDGGNRGQWRGRDGGRWSGQRSGFAERRFNDGGYRYPRGWYPRQWGYGEFLPYGWYGQDYWLDFGAYDLQQPPYGAEWVRVGNDALLIDMATGQVLSVEYGLFV